MLLMAQPLTKSLAGSGPFLILLVAAAFSPAISAERSALITHGLAKPSRKDIS
jgi:hypothetical protein